MNKNLSKIPQSHTITIFKIIYFAKLIKFNREL